MSDTSHAGAVSVDERRVSTPYGAIFVREAPGDGPAVVLMHGFPDDQRIYACHQYLNESGNGGLDSWMEALDLIDRLQPRHVVAGLKDKTNPDDTGAIQRTRDYITTFAELLQQQPDTREEFFDLMLERFPGYANPKALWRSIVALTQQQ